MKKEQTRLYKAWFNKEVGKRILMFSLWFLWIYFFILLLWSWTIKRDVFVATLAPYYKIFYNDKINAVQFINEIPKEYIPLWKEIELKPEKWNVTAFLYHPRDTKEADVDLEIDILEWNVWFHFTEFENDWWFLDLKYLKVVNDAGVLFDSSYTWDNIPNCYILRWNPRHMSKLSKLKDWQEFLEWENPNNCYPIYFKRNERARDTDWIIQFINTKWTWYDTYKVRVTESIFDWNRNE